MRLEFIGAIIVLTTALFASLQRNYPDIFGRISPGLAGLSITYALQVIRAARNNTLTIDYFLSKPAADSSPQMLCHCGLTSCND